MIEQFVFGDLVQISGIVALGHSIRFLSLGALF